MSRDAFWKKKGHKKRGTDFLRSLIEALDLPTHEISHTHALLHRRLELMSLHVWRELSRFRSEATKANALWFIYVL